MATRLEEKTKTFSLGVSMIGVTWYQTPQTSITSQSREEWLLQQNSKLSGHTEFSLNLSEGPSNTHIIFLSSRYVGGSSQSQPTTMPTQP